MEEIIIMPTGEENNYDIELYSGFFCGWGCSDNTDGIVCRLIVKIV